MRLHRHRDTRLEKRKHLAVTPYTLHKIAAKKQLLLICCLMPEAFFFFLASLSFCELRDCLEAIPLGNAVFGVHHMFATGTTSSDENL